MPHSALHSPPGLSPLDSDPRPLFSAEVPHGKPIHIARKMRGKRKSNVFLDDRGFLDQSHEFDLILHNTKGGPILCKHKHPAPPLKDVDPPIEAQYNEAHHGEQLHSDLDLSHLDPPNSNHVYSLLQKYWTVFDDKGLFILVKVYKCSIDTGSARPVCVKKISYDPREIPIMIRCIS
jgi:hypothetical protein